MIVGFSKQLLHYSYNEMHARAWELVGSIRSDAEPWHGDVYVRGLLDFEESSASRLTGDTSKPT